MDAGVEFLVSVSSTRIVGLKGERGAAGRRNPPAGFSILYSDRGIEGQTLPMDNVLEPRVSVSSTRIVGLKGATRDRHPQRRRWFQYPLLGSWD